MKFFQSARRFRSAIVLLLLASLLIWRHFFALPFIWPGQSVTLTAYNGETTQQKLIYTWQDMLKFHFTLLTAGARPAQLQQHADASQPVYGLSVAGVRKDFDAVVWDGLWIDNSGRVLSTDLDLSSLWEQLSVDTHTREGMSSLPCLRELALLSGQWDCRFLPEGSLGTPRADVPMILSSPAGHTLEWSVYSAEVHSFSMEKSYTIRISRRYLEPDDRVLLVDDILASGQAILGLLEIVSRAGAEAAGVGVAIEKATKDGGEVLRRMGLRVESLAKVERIEDGHIILGED